MGLLGSPCSARWLRRSLWLVGFHLLSASAPAQSPLEFMVKGTYLYKFADYVEWPVGAMPGAGAPLVIGILGEDPFGPQLDQAILHRSVQGRPVLLKRFNRLDQVRDVQILYVSPRERESWERIRAALQGMKVLTISDGAPPRSGIINFVILDNKVRFEVDAEAAERMELKLSSKLLSLAVAVKKAGGGG